MMVRQIIIIGLFITFSGLCKAQSPGATSYVSTTPINNGFPLFVNGKVAPIVMSEQDFTGVQRTIKDLQADIEKVTKNKPVLYNNLPQNEKNIIIIGTIGKNELIDQLVQSKKLDLHDIKGKWETFIIQTIHQPFPNIDKALVVVGSDKRGTIFGAYDISNHIGVSPWYWWADVPIETKSTLYIKPGRHTLGEPKVKYRGIFINDEAPVLSGWAHEKFGGFNHKFYVNVFELILRLKGNFLWPAMWGNAFYDDDPQNPILADEYGIVISTSHHEPMMRAHDEWRRYGKGKWNYATNDSILRAFWREGIKRMGTKESIVTLAMRGDGDEPMTQGTAIDLLERIVADQRNIIAEVTGKNITETPQVWALYKEVQDYYDKGMRVPDDVTLLLCDDNWGNIRKLPALDAQPRAGGYGIYYHFDYVGGPRNYKWVNTNIIPRIWEQMHLAYHYNARQIWVVNVGDIKPMELPIAFFLDFAWNPEKIKAEDLQNYYKNWAVQQFGNQCVTEIADLLLKYTKYNARRKPELLSPETYSLEHYNEFENIVKEYNDLAEKAQAIYIKIKPTYKDAYYQLVLYPILACANLNELYYTVALNRKYAKMGYAETNILADKAEALYKKDAELSEYVNKTLAGGKWSHFADQTHIGYTYWQQPSGNTMPKVERLTAAQIKGNAPVVKQTNNQPQTIKLKSSFKGFVEADGYVSMEAIHYSRAINTNKITWKIIPDIGKTGDGITLFPVTTPTITLNNNSPQLEYDIYLLSQDSISVQVFLSPTVEYNENKGLQYAISIDNETPQVVEIHKDRSLKAWEKAVADNIRILTTKHLVNKPGEHTLKFWAIDPGVVLQKIVIDTGGLKPSYLGPPESRWIGK
ncbi:MAG: glycosyl hydrolase 115 family protein [Saprospiraceae bacterium]